ncbi:ABC transporter permease [Klebsiella aerogenes]|uniref:ABC transporter permease n=1 Tax=Klebsiella aerogenes TaxID=548 RepID=UPI002DBB24FB|nr:ABC transporter permease [Klebsiella aerogenes]MEB5742686.1 ABC transporter permease [Klebsiella aerogenes]
MKKITSLPLAGFVSTAGSQSTWRELWNVRWLIAQLVRRDLTVRYRQTWLGWLWALLNPALNLAMYYTVFGIMIRMAPPEYPTPYVLVLLSGLILWMLFAATVNTVSETLLTNLHLIQKIWFPRNALTLAATGVSLMDFILSLLLLGCLLPLLGFPWPLSRLPVLLMCGLLTGIAGWGLGSLLAVLRLRYRDLRHLIPLLMQALFYLSPVVWTPGILPVRWQTIMACSPLTGLIGLFRHALLGGPAPSLVSTTIAIIGTLLMAMVGSRGFSRYEAQVVDRE